MKVKYHITEVKDGYIFTFPFTIDGKKTLCAARTARGFSTLTELDNIAKSCLRSYINYKTHGGSVAGIIFEWDGEMKDMPNTHIIGAGTYKKKEESQQDKDCLYEIINVEGKYTVIKHDNPLFTWDEAVEELRKRI